MSTPRRLETLDLPLDALRDWPDNPRVHDTERLDRIAGALGQVSSITVRPMPGEPGAYQVIGGHGFRDAYARAGRDVISAEVWDLDDEQAAAAVAALNGASDNAGYIATSLASLLEQVDQAGMLAGTGYTTDDLDDWFARAQEEALPLLAASSPALDEALRAAAGVPLPVGAGAPAFSDAPARSVVADLPSGYSDAPESDGTAGVRATPTLADYAARYAEKSTRSLVMDFPNVQFAWLIKHLAALREQYGADTNADLFVALIAEHAGEQPPAVE